MLCEIGARVFSTCSRSKYYALILSKDGRIVGAGYNGAPPGVVHCTDGGCPRSRNNAPREAPYDQGEGRCIAVHAEANALLHSDRTERMHGTLIVNGVPCMGCARLIAGSGIGMVVFTTEEDKRPEERPLDEMRHLLQEAGVRVKTMPAVTAKEMIECLRS